MKQFPSTAVPCTGNPSIRERIGSSYTETFTPFLTYTVIRHPIRLQICSDGVTDPSVLSQE